MKKLLTLLIITIIPLTMAAQFDLDETEKKPKMERHFGYAIRAGFSLSSMSANSTAKGQLAGSGEMVPAFNLGVLVDYPILKHLYAQSGLFFSRKGGKFSSQVTDVNINKTKNIFNAYYVQLPVLFSYRNNLMLHAKYQLYFGPYFSYGLFGKWNSEYKNLDSKGTVLRERKTSGDFFGDNNPNQVIGEEDNSYISNKRFDCGLTIGGGITVKHVYVGLNYELGLLNLANGNNWQSGSKLKNRNLIISLGYDF